MIVVPAIDLRDGYCVQLLGGDYGSELLRIEDPVSIAASWLERGFATLHVVDLDAATGRGSNREIVAAIHAGDWHTAYLAAWRQFLSRLEHRHLVDNDRTRTNREYLAHFRWTRR